MRVISVVGSKPSRKYLVAVQHRKFLLNWVAEYVGDITSYEGRWDWRRFDSDERIRSYAMTSFLNEAVMNYRRSHEE